MVDIFSGLPFGYVKKEDFLVILGTFQLYEFIYIYTHIYIEYNYITI